MDQHLEPRPLELDREVAVDLDVDQLWELVGDGDRWVEWLAAEADVVVEAGAVGRLVDDDGTPRTVVVDEVVPLHSVRFRWWADEGPVRPSEVHLVVLPASSGSRLRVTEVFSPLASASASAGSSVGARSGRPAGRSCAVEAVARLVAADVLVRPGGVLLAAA